MTTIGPTIVYPLPATGLSKQEYRQIQRDLNRSVLGKMGIVQTAATILANIPTAQGGYGVPDIFMEQVTQHVSVLQQHMHSTSVTGKLLRISFDQYTLEMGRGGSPLSTSFCNYTTSKTWVSNTIAHMKEAGIQLTGDLSELERWSKNDTFIMDEMARQGISNLASINKVRLYLRVVTVSDLLKANGKFFDTGLVAGF